MVTLQVVQVAVLTLSLFFVGYQVLLQRRQVRNQVLVQGHELYYLLAKQYVDLLREADRNPVLNDVWEAVTDTKRTQELDEAQSSEVWGAWRAMTPSEKQCYRYVRAAVEIFEQTYQLHQKRWIDDETWKKWQGWMAVGREVKFFDYVFNDTKPRLIASFVDEFTRLAAATETPNRHGRSGDVDPTNSTIAPNRSGGSSER
ncbi:MAG: hypothetical protein ACRDRH_02985 [Pseudonocardia sp.]